MLRPPLRWTEFAHLRFTGRDPHKPRLNKEGTAELIARLGLRGPRVHGVFPRIEEVDFAALPDRFVLKPTELSGKRGVMLLHRNPDGTSFRDGMLDRTLTVEAIVAEQTHWKALFEAKRRKELHFIVEDMIVSESGADERPREYKVYTFAGRPKLIVQYVRDADPPAVAFFDGAFRPIHERDGKVFHGKKTRPGKHVLPACAAEILDAAARISLALATPFVRVDFYAAREGAVLGELTVVTGGPYRGSTYSFSEAFDREMGRHWAEAAARLGQPLPLYDEHWSEEERRTSGLPVTIKKTRDSATGAGGGGASAEGAHAAEIPRPAPAVGTTITDFALIIGAMVSGTTSLYRYLAAHPRIAPCRTKEPDFFANTRNWRRGPDHYRAGWPDFDPALHRYALEASTNYTKFPRSRRVPQRMRKFGGRYRFLYIIRNPIDRIEAHLAHNVARGRCDAADAVDRLGQAIEVSRYAQQLEQFTRVFPRDSILLLDFAELRERPTDLVRRCLRFLELEEDVPLEIRPPDNVRRPSRGGNALQLGEGRRAYLRAALRDDVAALRDRFGFDVTRWGVL